MLHWCKIASLIAILSLCSGPLFYNGWTAQAQSSGVDMEALATRIANSVQQIPGQHYKNIAISRIKKSNNMMNIDVNELIDYTNVKIVRGRRFRVTDRSKLQLILQEQRIQLSDLVSPNDYRELGKVLGVQLFIYGTIYSDALVLKAIDVQTSGIIWAEIFALDTNSQSHNVLSELNRLFNKSLNQDAEALKSEKLTRLSFWNIETPANFTSERVIDYLSAAIAKNQRFSVVDRENLKMIFQEQKLNQEIFIDESQARRLGELYGVDAFVYGTISTRNDGSYLASLKMMSIFNGVIVWADLIKFAQPAQSQQTTLINPFDKKFGSSRSSQGMVYIPGGSFLMGSDDPTYDSGPQHIIFLKSYLIDRFEVSNQEYAEFVRKQGHRLPVYWKNGSYPNGEGNLPVVGITWEDAKLYCQYANKRMVTEAEWERAARGVNGRKFPWQSPNFAPEFAVTQESKVKQPLPVNTQNRDITPEGVMHLGGNVREFVADRYQPYKGSTRKSQVGRYERVVRGSSFALLSHEAAGYFRGYTRPNLAWPDIGFRCAKDS